MRVWNRPVLLLSGLALAMTMGLPARGQTTISGRDLSPARAASPFDREALVSELTAAWRGVAVARGFDLGEWQADVAAAATTRSASQLLAAVQAKSYEDAMSRLGLGGSKIYILGDEAIDVVFFPLAPCRIIDTHLASGAFAGRLPAGVPKSFSHNSNLVAQGGNAAGCGVPTDPAAIAVTFTAVAPLGPGDLRAWRLLDPVPNASVLNYAAIPALNIANTTILPTCQLCGFDFTVQADVSDTHLVADVVGYFWHPTAGCTSGQQLHHGLCFETNVRVPATIFTASDTCHGVGGRLPDPLELRSLRTVAAFALADEWTDSISSPDNVSFFAMTVADNGAFTRETTIATRRYRCVFSRFRP